MVLMFRILSLQSLSSSVEMISYIWLENLVVIAILICQLIDVKTTYSTLHEMMNKIWENWENSHLLLGTMDMLMIQRARWKSLCKLRSPVFSKTKTR